MLIMYCVRCEKRCYRSILDKGNYGLFIIRCIWLIGYKENFDVYVGTRRNNVS